MEKRSDIIDLVKAIGIISIMLGHSVYTLPLTHLLVGPVVYLYHLMVFFFTAGFCFKERYIPDPALYIGKRVAAIVPPFVKYNCCFVLLHNFLSRLSLIAAPPYSRSEMLQWIFSGFVCSSAENMLGAFWFLPVLLVACGIFAFCYAAAARCTARFSGRARDTVMGGVMVLCAAAGIFITLRGLSLAYHIQTSLLAVPFLFLGFLFSRSYEKLSRFLCRAGYLAAGAVLYLYVVRFSGQIELSANIIGSAWSFYPISLLGIFFCFSLARCIERRDGLLRRMLVYIGKNSFSYMALHFISFKLLDLILVTIRQDGAEVLSRFPHSYDTGLGYTVFSLVFISILLHLWEKGKAKISALLSPGVTV